MYLLALSILISALCPGEESGCIQGYVHDYYGVPMIGAIVLIFGTSQGDMTDSTAHYFISDVPPGTVEIAADIMVMGEEKDTVIVTPGDTLEVNFILASGLQYLPEISWKYNQETYPDTMYIVIEEPLDLDMVLSQVWVDDELMPSWVMNINTIATALPARVDSLQLRVFPFPDLTLLKLEPNDTVRIDFEENNADILEAPSGSPVETHNFIDITEWGNPDLINWGFMSSKVFYDDEGSMKLLLVFNERAVLIDQAGNSKIFDFPFPTFHYRTDPDCMYLLIWDICGRGAVGGDAALISLEDGRSNVFDPSPEKEIPDRGYYSMNTVLASEWITEWGKYHIASLGEIVRLNGSDFRKYNTDGQLLLTRSFEDIGFNDNHYSMQFLSCGQEAVSGIYNDDSLNYCFSIDLEGNLIHQSSIPFPIEHPVLRTVNIPDRSSAVVWMYSDRYGLARVDCTNGDFIYMPEVDIECLVGSQNRQYLGITVITNIDRSHCEHEIRDWETGSLIYSIPGNNPSRGYSKLMGVSDAGSCLISGTAGDGSSERMYSIYNVAGEIEWTFRNAPLTGPIHTVATMSPIGTTITIPYGRYIDIVNLSE